MDVHEKARILRFHRNRLGSQEHEELGWRTRASQVKRFEAMCRFGDLSGCRVLDLGCGHGDLKPFLDKRFDAINYLGVDFMTEFVTEANHRHGHLPNTRFVHADFMSASLPPADVIVCSGSFNYRSESPLHPYTTITRMWESARKGIAFNLLDPTWFPGDELVCGHKPDDILAHCRPLCPATELLNDYLPDDYTILMRK